jgi:hypothetical protein
MRSFMALLFALGLSGCVSTQAFIPPGQVVDFKQYEKVQMDMQDEVHTMYSREGTLLFQGLLKGKLQSMGYQLVEEDPDLIMNVEVKTFKPGSKALRLFIGFGAGRAELTYLATFKTPSGKTIAQLSGGKSYHGMELTDDQLFKSQERTRMNMIEKSVSQLGEFVANNGKLD